MSLVFNMASGYREIYKYYLMLQKELSINCNIFSLSMKELSLIYENPNTKETFKVNYNAFKSRKTSKLAVRTEGSKTITQKPDNMLSISKLGSVKAYEFVLDAKYKIDTSTEYQKSYGGIWA